MRPLWIACRRLSLAPQFSLKLRTSFTRSKSQTRYATYVLPDKTYPGEMGKDKVPYLLKTPKGTKDCICISYCSAHQVPADHAKGMDVTWSSEIEYSPPLPQSLNATAPSLSILPFSNSARSSPASTAKIRNSSLISRTKVGNYVPYDTTSRFPLPAGSP